MTETTLRFGPDWLRALSNGSCSSSASGGGGAGGGSFSGDSSSVISHSLGTSHAHQSNNTSSIGGDSRPVAASENHQQSQSWKYSREEILALYQPNVAAPDGMAAAVGALVFVEKCQPPVAFSNITEDEQMAWHTGVNSGTALRMAVRGGGGVSGLRGGRGGGSVDRGRLRARGGYGGNRGGGSGYDDSVGGNGYGRRTEGGSYMRGKSYERMHEMDRGDRGGWSLGSDRGVGGVGGSIDGSAGDRRDNWRSRGPPVSRDGEDSGGWRMRNLHQRSSDRWAPRTGGTGSIQSSSSGDGGCWRSETNSVGGAGGSYRRGAWSDDSSRRRDETHNRIIETDPGVTGNSMSIDSSHGDGFDRLADANHHSVNSNKDTNGRANEMTNDWRGASEKHKSHKSLSGESDRSNEESSGREQDSSMDNQKFESPKLPAAGKDKESVSAGARSSDVSSESQFQNIQTPSASDKPIATTTTPTMSQAPDPCKFSTIRSPVALPPELSYVDESLPCDIDRDKMTGATTDPPILNVDTLPKTSPISAISVAENELSLQTSATASNVRWFYTDPQEKVQGPFSNEDMLAWHLGGYFERGLLLRRSCDTVFNHLGDLETLWGRVPFTEGPAPGPIRERLNSLPHVSVLRQSIATPSTTDILSAPATSAVIAPQLASTETPALLPQMQQQQLLAMQQQLILCRQAIQNDLFKLQQSSEFLAQSPSQQHQTISQFVYRQQAIDMQLSNLAAAATTPAVPPANSMVHAPVQQSIASSDSSSAMSNPLQHLLQQIQQQSAAMDNTKVPSVVPPVQLSQKLSERSFVQPPFPPPQASSAVSDSMQSLLEQLARSGQRQGVPSPALTAMPSAIKSVGGNQSSDARSVWNMEEMCRQQIAEREMKAQETQRLEEAMREQEKLRERRQREEEEHRQRLQRELIEAEEKQKIEKMRLEAERRQLEEERQRLENERLQENIRLEKERKLLEEQQLMEKLKAEEMLRLHQEQLAQEEKRKEVEFLQQKKLEEINMKKQEEKRAKEALKQAEEREKLKKKRKEEAARQEEEKRRDKELKLKKAEEKARAAEQEALKSQQQQQQQKSQQQHNLRPAPPPSQPAWSIQTQSIGDTPSLEEIQRLEDRQRKEREHQEQLAAHRRREHQHQQQQSRSKWGSPGGSASVLASSTAGAGSAVNLQQPVKSLAEIQAEEERELAQRQQRSDQERRAQQQHSQALPVGGAWTGGGANCLNWKQAVSCSPSKSATSSTKTSSNANSVDSEGFWDSAISESVKEPTNVRKTQQQSTRTPASAPKQSTNAGSKRGSAHDKQSRAEQSVMKLFSGVGQPTAADEFHSWAVSALEKLGSDVDIPTFIGFLKDVDSPYDVQDYARCYLGDGREVKDFAKQFMERRSRWRNASKSNVSEDNMCGPARAVNPVSSGSGGEFHEVKSKSRRNKNKNRTVDSSILGFSVTSSESRLNVGERETIN